MDELTRLLIEARKVDSAATKELSELFREAEETADYYEADARRADWNESRADYLSAVIEAAEKAGLIPAEES